MDDLRYLQDFMTVELLYLHSRQAIMKVREPAWLHEPPFQPSTPPPAQFPPLLPAVCGRKCGGGLVTAILLNQSFLLSPSSSLPTSLPSSSLLPPSLPPFLPPYLPSSLSPSLPSFLPLHRVKSRQMMPLYMNWQHVLCKLNMENLRREYICTLTSNL